MHHQLETTIDIEAPPELVWHILIDLDAYRDWNPFIVSASGTVAVGERLTNRLRPAGSRPMTFKPTVTTVDVDRTFEWLGRVGLPHVFDGRHRFELLPIPSGTRLVQSEQLDGVLVRFLRRSLDTTTVEGFELMNRALKERAEARAATRRGT